MHCKALAWFSLCFWEGSCDQIYSYFLQFPPHCLLQPNWKSSILLLLLCVPIEMPFFFFSPPILPLVHYHYCNKVQDSQCLMPPFIEIKVFCVVLSMLCTCVLVFFAVVLQFFVARNVFFQTYSSNTLEKMCSKIGQE